MKRKEKKWHLKKLPKVNKTNNCFP